MMYLQVTYQHKALQMPEMIKQEALQLACEQGDKASQKFPIHFLWWVILVLTYCLQLLLYIFYAQSDLYMLVNIKAFLVVITRQK